MRRMVRCLAILLLLGTALNAAAQGNSTHLTKVADDIVSLIKEKRPDWEHRSVTPIVGSNNVIIDQWSFDSQVIKIAVTEHRSAEEAAKQIQKFASTEKITGKLYNLGDEGYSWSIRGSIAFRKGNLTIYISAVASDVETETRLSKEFAQLVTEALHGH